MLVSISMGQTPVPETAAPKWDAEKVKQSIKQLSETEYQLGEIKLDASAKTVQFPATLKIVKGPLEYLIVNEHGSAHESLFMTKVSAFELNVAMLLTGFKPSKTFFGKATPERLPGVLKGAKIAPESSLEVWVEWTDDKGKAHTHPAEDWIFNLDTKAAVKHGSWVYNGSLINQNGDLGAQISGNLIALYIDPNALANNPRAGNDNDDIWSSQPAGVEEGMPVTLIFKHLAEFAPKKSAAPPFQSQPPKVSQPKKP